MKRRYRIRVRAGWEYIPEWSYLGIMWEPLRRGMMGRSIGYAQRNFAQMEINNDRHIRGIEDSYIDDCPNAANAPQKQIKEEA